MTVKQKFYKIGDRVQVDVDPGHVASLMCWNGRTATIVGMDNPLRDANPIYDLVFDEGEPKAVSTQRWSYIFLMPLVDPLKEVFDFLDRLE